MVKKRKEIYIDIVFIFFFSVFSLSTIICYVCSLFTGIVQFGTPQLIFLNLRANKGNQFVHLCSSLRPQLRAWWCVMITSPACNPL